MFLLCPAARQRVGGVHDPPARRRLLPVPPAVRHVSLQLCLLPEGPLQHEGEHGDLRRGRQGNPFNVNVDFMLFHLILLINTRARYRVKI